MTDGEAMRLTNFANAIFDRGRLRASLPCSASLMVWQGWLLPRSLGLSSSGRHRHGRETANVSGFGSIFLDFVTGL